MPGSPDLSPWLDVSPPTRNSNAYRHRHITEVPPHKPQCFPKLKQFVEAVHKTAKDHIRSVAGISLDPFGSAGPDPARGYPETLTLTTLKGYLGEIMACIHAERHGPHDLSGWEVPIIPLVFHDHAFFAMSRAQQTGTLPGQIPGQPGDDCIAFILNDANLVTHCLCCEAKCTADHDSSLISEAHRNLNRRETVPVSLYKHVEILAQRTDEYAQKWVEALRPLLLGSTLANYQRYDLVMYVYQRKPIRKPSWMPDDAARAEYKTGRPLEVVEMRFNDVELLIKELYDKA